MLLKMVMKSNNTPEVTIKHIKKCIHGGNFARGGCITRFAKKNHLTIKEATVLIDQFVSENKELVDEEIEKSKHPPRHLYSILLTVHLILGIYFSFQMNDEPKELYQIIGMGVCLGLFVYIFSALLISALYNSNQISYTPTLNSSQKKKTNKKSTRKKNHRICCPQCGSNNIVQIDDGYEEVEECFNPDHIKDPKYYFSAKHFFDKDDYLSPYSNNVSIKTHKELWQCYHCGYKWHVK